MKYPALAEFLRKRREAMQPEDVGLPRGPRRRTPGLRREEVASLAAMSVDYYSRLEGGNGPRPSEDMLASISRAVRLTLDERDHLFRLAGHGVPSRTGRGDHVSPGLMRILDRLVDTPAIVLNGVADTLVQTPTHVALEGDQTGFSGLERSAIVRWFTAPNGQDLYDRAERENHSRVLISNLRAAFTADGTRSRAGEIVEHLQAVSEDFAAGWAAHEVGVHHEKTKHFHHPVIGEVFLYCDILVDRDQGQALLVFTAEPGSPSYEKLQLLSVLGTQRFDASY